MQAIFDEGLVFSFQEVVKQAVLEIMDGNGMPAFQQALRSGLNKICCTIQQRVMEAVDDQLRENLSMRKGWVVERRNDPKTILSPFGEVRYARTLFQNKKTDEYAYLADRFVGYTSHQRLDTLLEADLLEEAVDKSYSKAGKSVEDQTGIRVSGQTVLNIVRKLQPEKIELKEEPKVKKAVRILYIEADEDHVPHREKGVSAFEQRLVYVHEGRVKVGKDRYELIGKKYFTFPPGTPSHVIWDTIWRYLDVTYDLEQTEYIFISGDGVSWIQAGAEYIEDARYVLDGFHLRRAIFRAAGADEEKRKKLSEAVFNGRWAEMNNLLSAFLKEAETESRKKTISDVQTYLNNQRRGIRARRKYGKLLVGCSAEGHVSHVLSARLSSRPMGWSYLGANQMAHLRVHRENGVKLSQIYLEQSGQKRKEYVSQHIPQNAMASISKAVGSSFETLGNIPSFSSGSKGWAPLLRRMSNAVFKF